VKIFRTVEPSPTTRQIEVGQLRGAQQAVAEGEAVPHGVRSAGILVLAVLAVIYTLYLGKEILLPIALALVLKLLLQPAMRLFQERLRFPGALASLLLITAVFGAIAAVGFTMSVPASGWIRKAPESLPLLKEKLSVLREPLDYISMV
jgi:predicted PurR-regulated permease PerM